MKAGFKKTLLSLRDTCGNTYEKNQCMDPYQCYGVPPRDTIYLLGLKYPFLQPLRALDADSSQLRITLETVF